MTTPRSLSAIVRDYLNRTPVAGPERERLVLLAHELMSEANQGWPSLDETDPDAQHDLDL